MKTPKILEAIESYRKVSDFLNSKGRNSPKTFKAYQVALEHFATFLTDYNVETVLYAIEENKINVYSLLDQFVGYLTDRKLSSHSIILYVAGVRSYLEYYDIDISQNKFKRKVTMPKKHRIIKEGIDASDIRNILLNCTNTRLKVFILVVASSGLRSKEALTLRNSDIDFNVSPTKVHIRTENSKTGRSHDIWISNEATKELKRFIGSKRSPTDLVFALEKREGIEPNSIYLNLRLHFNKILEKLNLATRRDSTNRREISFHTLRSFVKSVIANQTNSDFSEWVLNHEGSTYYSVKENERKELYLKCEKFLTFLDYDLVQSVGANYESKLREKDQELQTLRKEIQQLERSQIESREQLAEKIQKLEAMYNDSSAGSTKKLLAGIQLQGIKKKKAKIE